MTHPLTPRENLMRPIAGIENRTAQEVFDIMSDRFRAHLTALASGSGDHAELVEVDDEDCKTCDGSGEVEARIGVGTDYIPCPDCVSRANKAEKSALLAENAALREILDERDLEVAEDEALIRNLEAQNEDAETRATEAEHKLNEAEEKIEDLTGALRSLAEGNLGGRSWQANYETIKQVARNAISKEAERG